MNLGLSHVPPGAIASKDALVPTVHALFGQALAEAGVEACPWRGCKARTDNAAAYSQHLAGAHGSAATCEVEDDLGYCGINMAGYDVKAHLELKHGLICADAAVKPQ